MSCQRLTRQARPAPLWHRARCPECRQARRADATVAFALACRRAERAPAAGLASTLAALDLPHALPNTRRARLAVLARRSVRPAIACAIAFAACGWGWLRWIDIEPNIVIPPPSIPATNGFSLFQSAASALVDPKDVDNAFDAGRSVSAAAPAVGAMQQVMKSPDSPVFSLAQQEGVVRDNAAALAYLKRGLQRDYAAPPFRSSSDSFSYLTDDRRLTRLLVLKARTDAARGRWTDSAATSLEAIELGIRIQKGGVIVSRLSGIACEMMGRRELWKAVGHLDASHARAAAARLAALNAGREPLTAIIEQEKWYGISVLQRAMREPGWRHSWAGTRPDSTDGGTPVSWAAYFRTLRYSKRRILSDWMSAMTGEVARVSDPYDPHALDGAAAEAGDDPIVQMLLPALGGLRVRDTDDAAQNALLMTSLALRAYRLDHGAYPPSLDALTPTYLARVPADPFAAGPAMHYQTDGAGYSLYSVGPDGEDNGGAGLVTPGELPQASHHNVQENSVGDIVAGVDID